MSKAYHRSDKRNHFQFSEKTTLPLHPTTSSSSNTFPPSPCIGLKIPVRLPAQQRVRRVFPGRLFHRPPSQFPSGVSAAQSKSQLESFQTFQNSAIVCRLAGHAHPSVHIAVQICQTSSCTPVFLILLPSCIIVTRVLTSLSVLPFFLQHCDPMSTAF